MLAAALPAAPKLIVKLAGDSADSGPTALLVDACAMPRPRSLGADNARRCSAKARGKAGKEAED